MAGTILLSVTEIKRQTAKLQSSHYKVFFNLVVLKHVFWANTVQCSACENC